MTEEIKCEICGKEFKEEKSLLQHKNAKHSENVKNESHVKTKKKISLTMIIVIAVVIVSIFGVYSLITNVKTLPPTTMQGHIEVNPPSHVLIEPMKLEVHKHMLEHADGKDIPGIVINYNCVDYQCESDLISNLEKFADFYPDNVYVAPFKNMDAKLALTKLNKIEILESYDEDKIHTFISGRVPTDEELGIVTSTDIEQDAEVITTQEEVVPNETENTTIQDVAPIVNDTIKEFTMTAKQWEFIPSEITVNEGDTVKLSIESVDVSHGILLSAFGVNEFLSPGNTVNIEFIADKKGEFSFFCNFQCGVGHSTMRGKIIVE